ncbi:MAG TPA: succinate dehydrogenase, cytochrome b556 subunit [Steroidobacteraceae bacterium]|jgi:succinate dehydrogenase / fumarate reductase cytochrome b subunit|nr:succinate dehydrogenase, cytochrome b556 subunit [Steroidobacteraceae bacterium]
MARNRPLSPHVMIYRWQIGNTLSILHRITGIALSLGLVALVSWLVALASGEPSYAAALALLSSPVGRFALMAWTFAFLYHLLNGIRHLFWDVGVGFERTQRHASGWLVVASAAILSVALWVVIWRAR